MGWTVASSSVGVISAKLLINGKAFDMSSGCNITNPAANYTATGGHIKQPPVACGNRRGGPRSRITCEVPKDYPHVLHYGRGTNGRPFFWKDKEWD